MSRRLPALVALAVMLALSGAGARPGLVPLGRNAAGFQEFRNARDGSVLIEIPPSTFLMGSGTDAGARPAHRVTLHGYLIGKYEVTNKQFARFVKETGYKPQGRWLDYYETGRDRYPVVYVSWRDAGAYCTWAGLRLPSEAEWERAARGTDGRTYPWGSTWDASRCNSVALDDPRLRQKMIVMDRRRGTLPVGSIASGASPCGALDMLGNALEWCSTTWRPYPWRDDDGRETRDERGDKVLRGGCWFSTPDVLSCFHRDKTPADYWYFYQYPGFRVARSL